MKFSLSVFNKIFKNPTQNVFNAKIENQSFRLMGWSYICATFNFRCKKMAKGFFIKWVKKCNLSALLNFASLCIFGKTMKKKINKNNNHTYRFVFSNHLIWCCSACSNFMKFKSNQQALDWKTLVRNISPQTSLNNTLSWKILALGV